MIADALTRTVFRTPEQVIAESLAKAHDRLTIGEPAEHMDGRRGIVQAIWAEGLDVFVRIELPDGAKVKEACGYWRGRSAL